MSRTTRRCEGTLNPGSGWESGDRDTRRGQQGVRRGTCSRSTVSAGACCEIRASPDSACRLRLNPHNLASPGGGLIRLEITPIGPSKAHFVVLAGATDTRDRPSVGADCSPMSAVAIDLNAPPSTSRRFGEEKKGSGRGEEVASLASAAPRGSCSDSPTHVLTSHPAFATLWQPRPPRPPRRTMADGDNEGLWT